MQVTQCDNCGNAIDTVRYKTDQYEINEPVVLNGREARIKISSRVVYGSVEHAADICQTCFVLLTHRGVERHVDNQNA